MNDNNPTNEDFAALVKELEEIKAIQSAQLDMAGETFEEIAVQASIQDRESDLRLGQWRLNNLGGKSSPGELISNFTVPLIGGVLAIYFQPLIQYLEEFPESVRNFLFWALGGFLSFAGLWALIVLIRHAINSMRSKLVRRALTHVVHDYSRLSAVSVTLKEIKQKLIAKSALLRPYADVSWEDVDDIEKVRSNISEVALLTAQRKIEEEEFEARGGERALQVMQECMRGRIPPFVYGFLRSEMNQEMENLKAWKKRAIKYCKALRKLDEQFLPEKGQFHRLKEAISGLDSFNADQRDYLASECKASLR